MEEITLENDILVLALGSNLGNREQNIQLAYQHIESHLGPIIKKSSFIQTAPEGFFSDEYFLNTCIVVKCTKDAFDILSICKEIETQLGRVKTKASYEDRPIDIDIIFYGQRVFESKLLSIPHLNYFTRSFVLTPLLELSNFQDPKTKVFISEIK